MNLNSNPTKSQLRALLASCDDDAGCHVIWVGQDGKVHAEQLPKDLTPFEWEQRMGSQIKFRYETLDCGNRYVGEEASKDPKWVDELFGWLERDWARGAEGYLDY
jgi:hypothetical protein